MTQKRIPHKRSHQRGIALVWMSLAMTIIVVCTSLVVDMGWLYFRRERLQAAVDSAALAGDWALTQNYSDDDARSLAKTVLQNYGYDPTIPSAQFNPHSNGVNNNFTVIYPSAESMFFGGSFVNNNVHQIQAAATATFDSYATMWTGASYYGSALTTPFVYCAYGPDQGATRGDAINTRWTDITGEYAKTPNPLNYNSATGLPLDTGVNYVIQPGANYLSNLSAMHITSTKLRVEIYDPETYVPSGSTTALDQYVTTAGGTNSSASTPQEKWIYTLYAQNNTTLAQTQIATATYGETQTNLFLTWVTPPGFDFDVSSYDLTNTSFVLNVKTGNPYVAGQNNALDKNGYLLRAGPDYAQSAYASGYTSPMTSSWTTTDSNGDLVTTNSGDTTWHSNYGNNSTYGTLAPLGCENNLPLTAHTAGSGTIALGTLGANPNTTQPSVITVNAFDEDSGATGVSYTVSGASGQAYNNTAFTGILGWQAKDNSGNGIWSSSGPQTRDYLHATTPSNTMYFAPGVYQGGTWVANYATGAQDCSTWNWTVNWNSNSGTGKPYLVYTTHNDY